MMYDPFADYFGLSNLVAKMEKPPICPPASTTTSSSNSCSTRHAVQDFNSNGVDVTDVGVAMAQFHDINNNIATFPTSPQPGQSQGSGSFTPLTLESIAELSKVMRGKSGLRTRLGSRQIVSWCVFCKNNGESELVYASHKLKSEEGLTTCPILRAYTCPLCGVNGDGAHTIKYCPVNKDATAAAADGGNGAPGTIGLAATPAMGAQHYRTPRTSTGRRRTASLSGINNIQSFASS